MCLYVCTIEDHLRSYVQDLSETSPKPSLSTGNTSASIKGLPKLSFLTSAEMRVLCLHGMGTNAGIFETQTGQCTCRERVQSEVIESLTMLTSQQRYFGLFCRNTSHMSSLMQSAIVQRQTVSTAFSPAPTRAFTLSQRPRMSRAHMNMYGI